jgi:NAD-dependent dihydropyrimidine dehydrogenase PreA subunit
MCHICEEYGNPEVGSGRWYLKPENYARNMYKLRMPSEGFKGPEAGIETGARTSTGPTRADLFDAIEEGDEAEVTRIIKVMEERSKVSGTSGQVLTLEDYERVLDLCSPIGAIACLCRKGTRAIDERTEAEYTCMGMGVGMLKWERWPERYKGGVKFLTPEEAKEWARKCDQRGLVHTVMLFGAPYIGGACQCDYPDCEAIRGSLDFGSGLLKGHEVAQIDYDICNGCARCIKRCQFGALKFEVTNNKANVDQFKCYGCGLCQTICPQEGAIKMVDKTSLPALAEVW